MKPGALPELPKTTGARSAAPISYNDIAVRHGTALALHCTRLDTASPSYPPRHQW